MGWRDRDYARWTNEERARFLGSASTRAGASGARGIFRPGIGVAVAVSAVALAVGQLPRAHPIAPFLHFRIPAIPHATGPRGSGSTAGSGAINLPATARAGSYLTLRGRMTAGESGTVSVDASYDGGVAWYSLASVPALGGAYTARVQLTRVGSLQLRVTRPDGSTATGTLTVTA